ncbi:MAG: outer membrane beta-barrel protein [Acidobacteria bacterium]|nr:outer membrane beta-barrel protein [Acidobacteriota bacterium]
MKRATTLGASALLTLLLSAPATAQEVPDTGGRVFGLVGGVFGDGDSAVMTSAGAGIRISRHLGLDLELFHAGDLGLPVDPGFVIQTFGPAFAPVERVESSRLVSFLTRMTVEFPVADGRLWPYLTGGGGIGNLHQTLSYRNLPLPRPLPQPERLVPAIFPGPNFELSSTNLALTFGGGLDVRLWKGLAVGTEARYFRLLHQREGFDFAFVTSRVSYRF